MSETYVYFVRPVGADGPIKIGCSKMPVRRLKDLMTWSPVELEVILTVPGDFATERNIHDCLWNDHLHREWFGATPRVLAIVAKLKSGLPLAEAMDLSARDRSGEGKMRFSPERRVYLSYSHRVEWAQRKLSGAGVWSCWAPSDVKAIMDRWSGFRAVTPVAPTPDEMLVLDAYLADPATHSVAWEPSA
jgi:hypothetical protein